MKFIIAVFCIIIGILEYRYESPLKIAPIEKVISMGMHYQKIKDAVDYQFDPLPFETSNPQLWPTHITYPKTFVLTIGNGQIYSDTGIVIFKRRYLIDQLMWQRSPFEKLGSILYLKELKNLKKIKGRALVLTQQCYETFSHWMIEILPKLSMVNKNDYDWIVLPQLNYPFQRESLQKMGIDFKKIIELEKESYIEFDEIIIPSFVSRTFFTPVWVSDYLRSHLLPKKESDFKKKYSKIFISREKAKHRRVVNENDIFVLLKPLGFHKVILEDLPLDEQIQLFNNAHTIISFHGSGLTNLIFCKPGSHLIELFQEHEDYSFFYLSQTMKLKYTGIKTVPFKKNAGHKDTIVDLSIIKNMIKNFPFIN
jgi:hypothetical protein